MNPDHIVSALAARRPKVLVLGDVILDRWCEGEADRLCREGPVPVLDIERTVDAPGGAANTAANLAALGAEVVLIGVAGDDEPGEALSSCLSGAGVGAGDGAGGLVRRPGKTTSVKARMLAQEHLLLRVDSCRPADEDEAREVADRALAVLDTADAVVVCDYGLGALAALDRVALRRGARALVVDARHFAGWTSLGADVATPNAEEAAALLGEPSPRGDRREWAAARSRELEAATGAKHTLVTLDTDGTILLGRSGSPHTTSARPAPEQNAVGAGDTFVAGLAYALAVGLPIEVAADVGQAAADVVVETRGTTACSGERLAVALSGGPVRSVSALDTARAGARRARAEGRAVVLTNGVFDGLHRGHTAFLEEASRLGGLLVVGVNSDESARRLHGVAPEMAEDDRAAVVAALASVDHALIFDSETAVPLIEVLEPDVYVKGGDYLPEMLAEASAVEAVGGRLEMLGYVERGLAQPVDERAER
ncbi:bifunctional D-glycero-beta-D-manno-heptose-7-phosphate kinase/D-glycero-beta-D-manno-heptose 1-phosphate adenylyltransferase HldE [Sinomonas notoginsengisoli]|uniref:PfkB family carbohydrate kinase n=1 Tax=Sinomonas notoginsengisoli TaxID=1457311 RepID=UPI001F1A7C66|nr:PfkB family carbohydrate kinase [Sinomonas notoginsengisoli]